MAYLGFLHPEDGTVHLTPAYDVVPTYHYRGHHPILAQTVNGQKMRPETVTWKHLLAEVRTWKLRGADEQLEDAVEAVRNGVQEVGPPLDSPELEALLSDVKRLLP